MYKTVVVRTYILIFFNTLTPPRWTANLGFARFNFGTDGDPNNFTFLDAYE